VKKIKKLFICGIVIGIMSIISIANADTALAQAHPIGLVVNGDAVNDLPTPPIIRQDRMLVPARAVFENLGAIVDWNPVTNTVYIQYGEKDLTLVVGRNTLSVNGQAVEMPVAAQLLNDRTMIPLAAVATNLGFEVLFANYTVYVNTLAQEPEPIVPEETPETPIYPEEDLVLPELSEEEETTDNVPQDDSSYGHYHDEETIEDEFIETPIIPPSSPNLPAPGGIVPARDVSTVPIQTVAHPLSSIFFVGAPQGTGPQVYTIIASSPISGVERRLLEDNRLILDIQNSTTLVSGVIPVPASAAVRGMRVSQFETSTTRVVFDLEGGTDFSIALSADRTTITLTIYQNRLTDISFEARADYDLIVLRGIPASAVRVQPTTGQLMFNIANTTTETTKNADVSGGFASRIELNPFNDHSVLLSLMINDFATSHSVTQSGHNEVTIRLQRASFQNISYNFDTRTFYIRRSADTPLNINSAVRHDMYHQQRFTLSLPTNASNHLGFGEIIIADPLVNSLSLNHTAAGTQLVFNGNQIFTLDVQQHAEYYSIQIMHPRQRYQRIVVIDPGHGGRDPGAVRYGIRESDLVLQITHKLLQLIEADENIRAYTTRNTDVFVSLEDRARMANNVGDMFVSIHINAARNTTAYGIETYHRPNAHDNFRALTSRNLADIMHRHKLVNLGSNDRGVRTANFAVLRYSTVPSVLLELGFLSNAQDRARMTTPEFQWQAARAIYAAMLEGFLWIPDR